MSAHEYKSGFKECAACFAKPGSPTLCESCLNNRSLIEAKTTLTPEEAAKERVISVAESWHTLAEDYGGGSPETHSIMVCLRSAIDHLRAIRQPKGVKPEEVEPGTLVIFAGTELPEAKSYRVYFRHDGSAIGVLEGGRGVIDFGVNDRVISQTVQTGKTLGLGNLEDRLIPSHWTQEETDGIERAYRDASKKHGHYESLFAAAVFILRHRARVISAAVDAPKQDLIIPIDPEDS